MNYDLPEKSDITMSLRPSRISSPLTFNHVLEHYQKATAWKVLQEMSDFHHCFWAMYTATNPGLLFFGKEGGVGRERLTRISNRKERFYQDTYSNQIWSCPLHPLWELLSSASISWKAESAKIPCAYGWGEQNKGLHQPQSELFTHFKLCATPQDSGSDF